MHALIIIKEKESAFALKRYFKFLYKINPDIIDFSPLKANSITPFLKYDLIISEIYDEDGKNYGLQFGSNFEGYNKKIIYFFSLYTFNNEYDVKHLPPNCFYLPLQLHEFLKSFGQTKIESTSAEEIMTLLKSRSITSSHH